MKHKGHTGIARVCRHLFSMPWLLTRQFPPAVLQRIELAIKQSEARHGGEIRFVVEADLHPWHVLKGKQPRHRAIELFSQLGIWDTEHNNGVLVYLLLADHDVEIVADRGIHQQVGSAKWEAICKAMETAFRRREFEAGVLLGLHQIGGLLLQYYPEDGQEAATSKNELPDAVLVIK